MLSRRQFMKLGLAAGAGLVMRWNVGGLAGVGQLGGTLRAEAASARVGLSDPTLQPKFAHTVPDALAPGFRFRPKNGKIKVAVGPALQMAGLVGPDGVTPVTTPVWGYGAPSTGYTWPGKTFEVQSGVPIEVKWENKLVDRLTGAFLPHLLPVDTSLHWAYSLTGYSQYTIANSGVPIVSHLHGGHTNSPFDGNPEFYFSPGNTVRGPQWVDKDYVYDNSQPAGNLWYHDHALGITRLNVYAGLAGFYFVRDAIDTGKPDNPLGLPAWPYEKAYAIQDRMFLNTGELFFPAFPGDPYYDDFITGEGAVLPPDVFPSGGPAALAEFFGDHMVVNGVIWPKENVEPRNYRLHLLNGTDSRFMAIRFRAVPAGEIDFAHASDPLPFWVIGSDQGLAGAATQTDMLLSEPGSRYDVVFDFKGFQGQRIVLENIGGDEPFGGDIPGAFLYTETNRIMAFDVADVADGADGFDPAAIHHYTPIAAPVDRVRKVALFEGMDEFGRLQPLLGTAEPATDYLGNPILDMDGNQLNGSLTWHMPTTENPALGATEIWEIYNATMDAHPVHLHLVHFDVLDRQQFTADVIQQPAMQHNGTMAIGYRLENIALGNSVSQPAGVIENAPKDMVTALPGQVTRIKATFDKPGHYVWHCHILSHEDHEMMRVLHVGPGA